METLKKLRLQFWLCSPIVCRAFDWWGLVSVCVCAFGVGGVAVLWLAWALWVDLGCLLGSLVLCCAGGFCPAYWRGLMEDETSSHYIFLFMLLLIPFCNRFKH